MDIGVDGPRQRRAEWDWLVAPESGVERVRWVMGTFAMTMAVVALGMLAWPLPDADDHPWAWTGLGVWVFLRWRERRRGSLHLVGHLMGPVAAFLAAWPHGPVEVSGLFYAGAYVIIPYASARVVAVVTVAYAVSFAVAGSIAGVDPDTIAANVFGLVCSAALLVATLSAMLRQQQSRLREQMFTHAVMNSLDAGVVACDAEGTLRLFNAAARAMHDHEVQLVEQQEWVRTLRIADAHGDPVDVESLPLSRALRGERVRDLSYAVTRADGRRLELSINGQPVVADGEQIGAVIAMHDVTERREAERELHRLAHHDDLTGLRNRRALLEDLGSNQDGPVTTALLLLDLDDFKAVNDTHGHDVGDALLHLLARRISAAVRPGDLAVRLGGDEFAILLRRASLVESVGIAERLMRRLQAPALVRDHLVVPRLSAGIAPVTPGSAPHEALRNADIAMYAAKRAGRRQLSVFEPAMYDELAERTHLANQLRTAVPHELEVHYQPIITTTTGRIEGFEALVRWRRDGTLIAPDDFISLAEGIGVIGRLGEYVLTTACEQAAGWSPDLSDSGAALSVSVNVAPLQLSDSGFFDMVTSVLASTGLAAERLVLEITESILADEAAVTPLLTRLRRLGVRIAIDDFGAGFSSLGRLHGLPVDEVKLDKTLTDTIDEQGSPMVRATLDLIHALGLRAVAEGVEHDHQLQHLARWGCDAAQGYLIGRPSPTGAPALPHHRRP